jgi:hypothetical protein
MLVFSLTVTDDAAALHPDPDTVTITAGNTAAARILLVNTAEGGTNGVTFLPLAVRRAVPAQILIRCRWARAERYRTPPNKRP